MNYKEKYENALEKAREYNNVYKDHTMMSYAKGALEDIFPELKESENEIIRKEIINYFKCQSKEEPSRKDIHNKWIAWLEKQGKVKHTCSNCKTFQDLHQNCPYSPIYQYKDLTEAKKHLNDETNCDFWHEKQSQTFTKKNVNDAYLKGICDAKRELEKQGDTNETINRDKFAQGVLKGATINLITWIDYNAAEGNMCLSNMECKDIEDALVSGDWDKIYAYIKKKLEKQGEQKPAIFIPKFHVGDKLVSTKNPSLTYEVLEVGHINELGNQDYKVEIFTDRKVENPRNIQYIECYKVDEWAELIERNSAWSDEDEQHCRYIIDFYLQKSYGATAMAIEWLENLKNRVQPHWKPTNRQLNVLQTAIKDYGISREKNVLESLYNDLKKL